MAPLQPELLEDVDIVRSSPVHTPPSHLHRRARRAVICTLLLLLVLVGVIAVGIVHTARLQKKQAELSATVSSQAAENEELRNQNSSLSSELDSQKSQNAALSEQNELLKSQVSQKIAQAEENRQPQTATNGNSGQQQSAGNTAKMVALTFDDGPGQYTAELLDYLKAHHVHATFFLVGKNAARYPSLIQRMDAEGHAIGNHTQNHARLTRLSADGVRGEIESCNAIIRAAVGHDAVMLRAPGGNANDTVKGVAKSMGLPLAYWSVDTRDWESRNTQKIVNVAFGTRTGIKDGSIVLMHDIYRTTVDAAKQIIPRLESQGYTFVTVPELLAARRGGAQPGETYVSAYPGR